MKYLLCGLQIAIFGLATFAATSEVPSPKAVESEPVINIIEGMVYDPNRRGVPEVYVELQNSFNSTISRQRTASSGRFVFIGVQPGQYYIKVWTTGTNYEEQTQSVEVVSVLRGANDTVYIDFYMKYDRRKTSIGVSQISEVVFVQEIPDPARKLYKSGVKDLNDNFEKGAAAIDQALAISPDYYDALNALGTAYVVRKEYEKAAPYLIKAIDINRQSFSSFYSLAYAAYQLKHLPEAVEAARAATILAPGSVNAQLLYGTVLRLSNENGKALDALLKANRLSKEVRIADIHWQLALLYNEMKRYKDAANELETYLAINPDAGNKKQVRDLIQQMRTKFSGS
ncbi:MAG: tetratricopeptide repeat protein [Acidobacteriota bacterium]